MEIAKQLRYLSLFKGVSPERLLALTAQARYRTYGAAGIIVLESEKVKQFYVVVSGKVKLYKCSPEGKEQTLFLVGPGDPFGLCTAFANDAFPASAMALEPSGVLIFPGEAMEAAAREEPALLFNILRILAGRLRDSLTLIESLSLQEIPQRLASFLLREIDRGGGRKDKEACLVRDITQREIAKILGATPETLSRALKKLAEDGMISVDGRQICVNDRDALCKMAAGG